VSTVVGKQSIGFLFDVSKLGVAEAPQYINVDECVHLGGIYTQQVILSLSCIVSPALSTADRGSTKLSNQDR
jgi:hypothetical protein